MSISASWREVKDDEGERRGTIKRKERVSIRVGRIRERDRERACAPCAGYTFSRTYNLDHQHHPPQQCSTVVLVDTLLTWSVLSYVSMFFMIFTQYPLATLLRVHHHVGSFMQGMQQSLVSPIPYSLLLREREEANECYCYPTHTSST